MIAIPLKMFPMRDSETQKINPYLLHKPYTVAGRGTAFKLGRRFQGGYSLESVTVVTWTF